MAASNDGIGGKELGTRMNGQHTAAAIAPEPRDDGQSHDAATHGSRAAANNRADARHGPSQNDSLAAS